MDTAKIGFPLIRTPKIKYTPWNGHAKVWFTLNFWHPKIKYTPRSGHSKIWITLNLDTSKLNLFLSFWWTFQGFWWILTVYADQNFNSLYFRSWFDGGSAETFQKPPLSPPVLEIMPREVSFFGSITFSVWSLVPDVILSAGIDDLEEEIFIVRITVPLSSESLNFVVYSGAIA